jgi:protease-4
MGALAGSGGYYIAMDADRIVAQPATLTGSIGVVMQKPNAAGLMARLGIQVETVAAADTQPLSLYRPFTDAQRQRYEERIDWTYNSFVQAVAAGRKLSPERAEQLAKGRVWTGRQAKELGLVDALGGIDVALRETRSVLGLAADAPVAVRLLPRQRSTFDEVLRFARGETNAELGQLGQGLQVLRLLAQVAAPVLRGTDETMRMDEGLVAP